LIIEVCGNKASIVAYENIKTVYSTVVLIAVDENVKTVMCCLLCGR